MVIGRFYHRAEGEIRAAMKNRDKERERHKNKRALLKAAAIQYLGGCCLDCGFSDLSRPEVFDFDHVEDKTENVATLINKKGWDVLVEELDKCELVCSNCHRTRTKLRGYKSGP